MRINCVQNNTSFKALQIRNQGYFHYNTNDLNHCREKLKDTKFIDVIIDSHGLAIKEKKTELLQRIQSFSLFPQENSISINMIGEKTPKYKFKFPTLDNAKSEWNTLRESSLKDNYIIWYTKIALWLENCFTKNS